MEGRAQTHEWGVDVSYSEGFDGLTVFLLQGAEEDSEALVLMQHKRKEDLPGAQSPHKH